MSEKNKSCPHKLSTASLIEKMPSMNIRDRMRAIKRHPQFIKDYADPQKLSEETVSRWLYSMTERWGYDPDRIMRADKNSRPQSYVRTVTHIEAPPVVSFKSGKNGRERKFETGKVLYIEVDPNGPGKQIKADFAKLIDGYMKKMEKKRERTGKRIGATLKDPFEIYDFHSDNKMTVQQIAEKLCHKDSIEFQSIYYQVRRALEKAKKMINLVTPPEYPIPFPNI